MGYITRHCDNGVFGPETFSGCVNTQLIDIAATAVVDTHVVIFIQDFCENFTVSTGALDVLYVVDILHLLIKNGTLVSTYDVVQLMHHTLAIDLQTFTTAFGLETGVIGRLVVSFSLVGFKKGVLTMFQMSNFELVVYSLTSDLSNVVILSNVFDEASGILNIKIQGDCTKYAVNTILTDFVNYTTSSLMLNNLVARDSLLYDTVSVIILNETECFFVNKLMSEMLELQVDLTRYSISIDTTTSYLFENIQQVTSRANCTNYAAFGNTTGSSLVLPNITNCVTDKTVSFTKYASTSFFPPTIDTQLLQSQVVTLALGFFDIVSDPVQIVLEISCGDINATECNDRLNRATCGYYDVTVGHWNSQGCTFLKVDSSNDVTNTHRIHCSCIFASRTSVLISARISQRRRRDDTTQVIRGVRVGVYYRCV